MVEPQKFFIGLIDFFSILLPGAVLTYVFRGSLGPAVVGSDYANLSESQGWVLFLFGSYLLGHLVFLIGAWGLDDYVYDPLRRSTKPSQYRRLSKGLDAEPRWLRRVADRVFKRNIDQLFRRAVAIRNSHLEPLGASVAVNAFQWSKARLKLERPEALVVVERFEADSKFFRSLVVVLPIWILHELVLGTFALGLAGLPFLGLSLWRYVDQRAKSTSQAYQYMIGMESLDPDGYRLDNPPRWATHAGAVVYRSEKKKAKGRGAKAETTMEYLLVSAKSGPDERVLPKGHIEPGETSPEAAVREVLEEAGVWAMFKAPIDEVVLPVPNGPVRCHFFLLHFVEEEPSEEQGRGLWGKARGREKHEPVRAVEWLSLDEALKQATHPTTRELLTMADRARQELEA